MTTPQKIIDTSFAWIGIKAAEEPLTASMIQDGLHQLNNFLAEEDAVSILNGLEPIIDLDTDLKEERHTTGYIEVNVAAKLAAFYDVPVSPSLAAEIVRTGALVTNASLNSQAQYPSTLPIGSGNDYESKYAYDNTFFPERSKDNF